MKTRIEEIMKQKELSSSQFADKIGVPRSGLSHVIKGRNKPSLDYVLRILKSFPEIDSNWLLTGEIKASNEVVNTVGNSDEIVSRNSSKTALKSDDESTGINDSFGQENDATKKELVNENFVSDEDALPYLKKKSKNNTEFDSIKKVKKIVFFYSDGSFEEYKN